jgi:hypothetical protein
VEGELLDGGVHGELTGVGVEDGWDAQRYRHGVADMSER